MPAEKWVYSFDQAAQAEADVGGEWEEVRALLGGKGANLAEMTRLGIPVPSGFTITTRACTDFLDSGGKFPAGMWEQINTAMDELQSQTGKRFGQPADPLLVSARSGAKFSMPGMMDTVLNIGLNDETVQGLAELTGEARFAYDAYRRLIQMFGCVVLEISDEHFEHILDSHKRKNNKENDTDMTAEDWIEISKEFKEVISKECDREFPQDPMEQLRMAIEAVFQSWNGKRAVDYRNAAKISHDLGTGVNIVSMVFGNMGDDSGTGVAFTRDPATGENVLYGDYLMNAQGEDVVAGIRNTLPIQQLDKEMPDIYTEFKTICTKLEHHYHDMQDVEFTIERGKLWMLQTRDGKRTATAAIKTAVDMAREELITKDEAVRRISPAQVDALLHPQFDHKEESKASDDGRCLTSGVNASPGAAVGRVYFDADTAERMAKQENQPVIMVRPFTKPDDVHGMLASEGILTSEGGATSHAAVVARQFGLPCVVGASDLAIDLEDRHMVVNGTTVGEGDWLSLNGTSGKVYLDQIATIAPKLEEQTDLLVLLEWADQICRRDGVRPGNGASPTRGLEVWANADYPADAQRARDYGARGIGLCRTEHMFFEQDRLPVVRRMILAQTPADRQAALDELLPHQREDFEGLFKVMDGLPVIVRLIDPPMHEFLPEYEDILLEVHELKRGKDKKKLQEQEEILKTVRALRESNPMMGMRGVRLSVMIPEIVEMQVRAIFEAAADATLQGFAPKPEVMIPLTGHVNELKFIQPRLERIAKQVMQDKGTECEYKFGTMIEIPRAALTAAEIAGVTEFFSFGTNDLTQMTYGYSRDDAEGNFLIKYIEDGILPGNPFQTIDFEGVGRIMQICIEDGRRANPDLEIGIC
ncbi:MAG: pyruvate, phosphate dikinase, partial [Anaerolineae bacterium]|nr:pyruvate, phosphate dikinase [Anaerolineae bacterium]